MSRNLRIIHCLRAPIGGLFRHVVDLALEQSLIGHDVGLVFDRAFAARVNPDQLALLQRHCRLGVRLVPMARLLSHKDFFAARAVQRFGREAGAQILHGHGAKGGAYARYGAASLRRRGQTVLGFYTPHGGSLHYDPSSLSGKIFLGLERKLARMSNGIIFESQYSADIYQRVVGGGFCPMRVIPNGLGPQEFAPNEPVPEAADFVFVGELRRLKGVDVLLSAMQQLTAQNPQLRLAIVGDGPDMKKFQALSQRAGLQGSVGFYGRLPTRQAFSLGQVMVVPSRAESFPYIVLEAGAAGMPLIATDVGGIPEIVAGTPVSLIPPDDAAALARKMADALTQPETYQQAAAALQAKIGATYTIERMSAQITDFYLALLRR